MWLNSFHLHQHKRPVIPNNAINSRINRASLQATARRKHLLEMRNDLICHLDGTSRHEMCWKLPNAATELSLTPELAFARRLDHRMGVLSIDENHGIFAIF